ncbi:hypothetical protein HY030_04090 [Candidatus Gottesmanbacteria bacterium]|nr:hypothetical protein [Candidatus Gottesmanbacteria bacterium]
MDKFIRSLLILMFFIIAFLVKNPFLPNRVIYSSATNFFTLIITAQDAIPDNYSVSLIFDHKKLVDQGKSLPGGDDIRIYYDQTGSYAGNELQLDRSLDISSNWNDNATKIWFKLPSFLAASAIDSTHYRLYYGNDIIGQPLQDKSKIFEYWDDFDDGNLSKWTIDAGSWREENGLLKAESGGAQIRNSLVNITDAVVETKINFINSGQYVGIFTRSLDFNNFYLFDRDGNANDWRLYRNLNNWALLANSQNYPAPQNNDILRIKNVGNLISTQINNQDVFLLRDTENVTGNRVGLFANGPNSYTEFAYFLVRKAVENEPKLTLGAETTITATSTPSPTMIPTPSSTPTPSLTPSPTVTTTPTPTPSVTPTPVGPKMIAAETQDLDNNGKIDHIEIIFDKDLNGTTVTNADFTVSSYLLSSNQPEETNGVVVLQVWEGVYFDTGATPEITLRDHGVKDLDGNWNNLMSIKTEDKIGPYILLTNPDKNILDYNSAIKISGIASDFSSSEDAVATDVKLDYKESSQSDWKNIEVINNNSFLEPFEWNLTGWTPPHNGVFDLKISASDLRGNISELIFKSINYDNNLAISLTPTPTATSTPTPIPTLTATPTITVTPTITPTPSSTPIPTQNFYNPVNNITYSTPTPTPPDP